MYMHVAYSPRLTLADSKYITLQKPEVVARTALALGAVSHKVTHAATPELLANVHSLKYIKDVMYGRVPDGFGTTDYAVMMQAMWACGAMKKGMEVALEYGNCLVPASGFHHASYASNWGYCTFNGMILAAVLSGKKTLIIDGDAHYGDGCVDIIDKLKLGGRIHYRQCFEPLEKIADLESYGLVIYQPGADSMEEGPNLSMADFRLRDYCIFVQCLQAGVPVLWCLGGGYKSLGAVTKIHTGSIRILDAVIKEHLALSSGTPGAVLGGKTRALSTHP